MSDPQFNNRIVDELKRKFGFKKLTGKYMQQGKCPGCDKHTLWCLAERPMVVKCDKLDNCGYDEAVRAILPDLFEDWSKRAPVTPDDPNATADAYLRGERGLDLTGLRGHFSQEHYHDNARGIGSATVRFPLPNNTWWERIIDRPGRFDRKARFKFGGSYAGHWWAHPLDGMDVLAGLDEIWLQEGIFDACSSRQNFPKGDAKLGVPLRTAVSVMSTNNYPEHALAALADACAKSGRKGRPKLIFAYDVGPAGVNACKAHVKRAQADGWDATAAQVRPDGEGTKLDWNDLGLRHADWKDDASSLTGPLRPFSEKALELYQWNGAVTLASTPREKARLIQKGPDGLRDLRSFEMRFENRIYWCKSVFDKEDNSTDLSIEEIANCAFRILYRERDDAADETNYFIQIDFPGRQPTDKARFTAACCAASGEFKKRLFAFSGMWSGSQDQLDRLMRGQTRQMKTVEPLHFTGYSAKHKAWVLGDIAVRDGRVIPINKESCFDFGKHSVKLATTERLLTITWDPDKADFSWLDDLWTAWGPRAMVTLGFFTMSLFAQQIRAAQKTLAFLEITGPPGSGKSTLIEFCWRLLGREGYEGTVPGGNSVAGMARTFQKVANLPVGLIEGERGKDQQNTRQRVFDWSELLVLYNGRSARTVGRKSGGTETFEPPFLGSIFLMQNERIDAVPAVLERLMSFHIDKAGWSPGTKAAARRIEKYPVEDISGYIVHATRWEERFLKAYFDRYAYHDEALQRRVPDLHNGRLILNHSQLAAAVEALGQLLPVKREWITETIKLIDWMALDRQHSCGADHPLIQRFWEQVDYLSSIETLNSTRPINLHRKPAELIAISIPLYEEKCRAHGQQAVDSAQLHKLLPGSKRRKFIGKQGVNCVDGKNRHCWLFEAGAPLAVSIDSADDVT